MAKIHRIEVNNIFYDYVIGAMWISIHTAEAKQWGEIPTYCRVDAVIQTPASMRAAEIQQAVDRAIREKTAEQRKAMVKA